MKTGGDVQKEILFGFLLEGEYLSDLPVVSS
jgi:hypothetical protein